VVVPRPEGGKAEEPAEAKPVPSEGSPFFEQNDFDDALSYADSPSSGSSRNDPDSLSRPVPAPLTYQSDVEPYDGDVAPLDFPPNLPIPGAPSGIVLSRGMATILSVVIVIALAVAFVIGLYVGRALTGQTAGRTLDPRRFARRLASRQQCVGGRGRRITSVGPPPPLIVDISPLTKQSKR